MAGVYKGLTIKVGADTTGLSDALNKIDSQSRSLKRNMSAIDKALKLDPKNTELARQKMQAYQKEVQQASKRLETLKAAESQIGKDGMSTEAWDTLQREIATTEGKLRKLAEEYRNFAASQSGLGKAGAAVTKFGEKLDSVSPKLNSIGNTLTVGVTAPIVAGATASVKAAVDIDSALTGVKKTVDATAEEYGALKEAAIEYSKVNAVSAVEVLNAEELGGQLGVAKENLRDFAEVTTGLSVSTNMNVEAASTNMARFMNVTQASADASKSAAEQYRAYGNVVVGLGNNLATVESEISDFSLRMASAGSLAGMSQADIMGLGGAMSSLGLEAEAGGTAFSNTITEISKAVSSGGEELEGFARVAGLSADEFANKWRSDATGAFIDFINGLAAGKDAGEDMNLVLDELGITGIRQSDAIRRLAGNTTLLSDAVRLANDEWRNGSALSDEVANRNESLASKFEMLRNRVIAVAEEVGAPLADAMLAAVDAAEPLFEAIEGGARAFSEMDEGEQRAVINTVALVAALGPGLKAFSKVTGIVQVLGGALTKLSQFLTTTSARQAELALSIDKTRAAQARHVAALGTESAALKAHEAQLVAAEKAEGRAAAASKASAVAMNVAKGAAIGLAVAGIAVLVSEIQKYAEHQQKLEKATTGLKDATSILDGSLSSQSGAFGEAESAARGYREEVDRLIESNAELAEKIDDTSTKVMGDAQVLQNWADRLREVQESFDGSPESLAALKAAVDGYNAATGSSIEITDEATGALSMSTAELQRNADAWIANSKAQAAQELVNEAVRGQVEAEMALADAHDAASSAQAAYNAELEALGYVTDGTMRQLADAEKAEREAQGAVDARAEAVEKLNGQYERYTQEAMLASQATDDFRNAIAHGEGELSEFDRLCEGVGQDADDLAGRMTDAGISTRDFAKVGADAFAELYGAADGDLAKVRFALENVDRFEINPKHFIVDDDGTIRLEDGRVVDLDSRKIDGKTFTVDDDGTIRVEGQAVDGLRGKIQSVPPTWATSFYANDFVSNVVDTIKSKISEVRDASVSISASPRNASGGVSPEPIRRVPRHASGGMTGIVTRATLTSAGLVGEAGAEYLHDFGGGTAIVPIQNSRYVRPLARSIAAEMGGFPRAEVHNHYSIGSMTVPADSALAAAMDGVFAEAEALMAKGAA